jgi:hypothetical protein
MANWTETYEYGLETLSKFRFDRFVASPWAITAEPNIVGNAADEAFPLRPWKKRWGAMMVVLVEVVTGQ